MRVQLLKNGKEITAFAPLTGAIAHINEHDEVLVEGLGGRQGGSGGRMGGVKMKGGKGNGVPLESLRTGKAKKAGGK